MTHDELQNNSSDTGTKVPMNHDELLAKIDAPNGEFDAGDPTRHHLLLTQNKALRAVVELPQELPEPFYLIDDARPEEIAKTNYWLGYRYAMTLVIKTIKRELG